MKKFILYSLGLLMLVACAKKEQQTQEEKVVVVSTTTLRDSIMPRIFTVSSNLQGYQTVNVSPSITGIIEHIYVEVGDVKQAGDLLVRMDQQQYKNTKLAMANLEIEKNRMDTLIADGSVSQQAYDQVKLSYDQTKETLQFYEENTFVRAPFSGVISAKTYEDGDLYSGQPIVVLTQVSKLKTIIAIPEIYYPKVKKGMTLTLTTPIYPGRTFQGFIEVVYPTIDPSTHTFQCKVQVPNGSNLLHPGMYVTSSINLGDEKTIIVPYQSVEKLVGSNERYVFINKNGRAKRVTVTLGERYNEDVEIISPEITAGVEYISVGQHKVVDGSKIQISNQ